MQDTDIALNLRRHRQLIGISQTKLARAVGCAPAYISQIEAGLRRPSLKICDRLCLALDIPLTTLLAPNDPEYEKGTVPLGTIINDLMKCAKALKARSKLADSMGAPIHQILNSEPLRRDTNEEDRS